VEPVVLVVAQGCGITAEQQLELLAILLLPLHHKVTKAAIFLARAVIGLVLVGAVQVQQQLLLMAEQPQEILLAVLDFLLLFLGMVFIMLVAVVGQDKATQLHLTA
jgi:hypothetical protein